MRTGTRVSPSWPGERASEAGYVEADWISSQSRQSLLRTALINVRAILLKRGHVAPQGKRKLERFLSVLMDEQGGAELSPRIVLLIADARAQWAELDQRIATSSKPETTASASRTARRMPPNPQRRNLEISRTPDLETIIKPGQFSMEIQGRISREIDMQPSSREPDRQPSPTLPDRSPQPKTSNRILHGLRKTLGTA